MQRRNWKYLFDKLTFAPLDEPKSHRIELTPESFMWFGHHKTKTTYVYHIELSETRTMSQGQQLYINNGKKAYSTIEIRNFQANF